MLEVDLSDDYENAKYISNAKSFPEKWQKKATNFRNERALFSNLELDIPYGPSDREKMDIFYPKKELQAFSFLYMVAIGGLLISRAGHIYRWVHWIMALSR